MQELISLELIEGSITILDLPDIQNRLDNLIYKKDEELRNHFNKISNSFYKLQEELISINHECLTLSFSKISYEYTKIFFRNYFIKQVLNYAIIIALDKDSKRYNILDNILDVLSGNATVDAIIHKAMLDAFCEVAENLTCDSPLEDEILSFLILKLKKQFETQ